MKKYLNLFLLLVVFFIGFSILFSLNVANAATNDCKPGQAYDTDSGISCALIATCQNTVKINHITGALCPGVNPNSVTAPYKSLSDFIADSLDVVRYGDKGWDVAALQTFLAEKGFLARNYVTGKSLINTKLALKKFQKTVGLKPDGIAGRLTINKVKDVIRRSPDLADSIGKGAGGVSNKDNTTGNTESGPVSGGNQSGNGGSQCEPPHNGTKSQAYEASITTDNYLMIYKWNKVTQKLTLIHKDLPSFSTYILDRWMGWQTAEKFSFTLEKDEELVWVAVNDAQIDDGIAGHFIIKDASGTKVSLTRAGVFERMRTTMLKPDRLESLAVSDNADIVREIKNGQWQSVDDELGPMGMSPWGPIPGISNQAKWLPTWGVREVDSHITIFKTKFSGDGALPPCTCPIGYTGTLPDCIPPITQTCPDGTIGTYPNCTPQICPDGTTGTYPNCNFNGSCPSGWTGTPPQCVPPPGPSSLTGSCRGIAWPELEVVVKVKFNQPVLVAGIPIVKVLGAPNSHGVEMAYQSSSSDKMTLTFKYVTPSVGSVDPNNYKIEDYLGNGKLGFKLPLPSGSSIKRQSDGVNAVLTGEWAIPSDTIKCVGSAVEVISNSGECRGVAWPALDVTVKVKFTKAVNLTGGLKIKVLGAPNDHGVELPYVSGSGTDTLKFRYIEPAAGLPNPNNYQYQDYIGNGKFGFVLPLFSGSSLKDPSGLNVNLAGDWNIPDDTLKCVSAPLASVLSGTAYYRPIPEANESNDNLRVDYFITFTDPVVVSGTSVVLKIKKANGEEKVSSLYKEGSGTNTLRFHASDDPLATGNNWETDYEGTGVIYLNGSTIKSVSTGVNANIAVPLSVIFKR